jgi:hypothetical protein
MKFSAESVYTPCHSMKREMKRVVLPCHSMKQKMKKMDEVFALSFNEAKDEEDG